MRKFRLFTFFVSCFAVLLVARAALADFDQTKLTASDGAAVDYFGSSVAVSGDTAVVGGDDYTDDFGSAYVFRYDGCDRLDPAPRLRSSRRDRPS